jgi:hypothetical protein
MGLAADRSFGSTPGLGKAQYAAIFAGAAYLILPLVPLRVARALTSFLGASFATLLLGLVAGEVALRIFLGPLLAAKYELDADLLYRRIPGATSGQRRDKGNGGGVILTRTSMSGFRNEEPIDDERTTRVIVYGDSFVEGTYSKFEATFAEQLEACLRDTQRDVEVLNAGVTAYGPDQALLRMEREFPRWRPDYVVMMIYAGNDFGDLFRNKLFRVSRSADTLERLHPHVSPETATEFQFTRRSPYVLKVLRQWTESRRIAAEAARVGPDSSRTLEIEAYRQMQVSDFRAYVDDLAAGKAVARNLLEDYQDVALELGSDAGLGVAVRLMGGIVAEASEEAARHGAGIIFVVVPSPVNVVPDYGVLSLKVGRYPTYQPRLLVGALDSILTAQGVNYLNLEPTFIANQPDKLYLHINDIHWNDAGQALAARIVCDRLAPTFSRVDRPAD